MFFFSAFCSTAALSTGSVGVIQKFGEYQGVQEPGCSCDLAEPMEIPRKIVNSGEFYSAYIYILYVMVVNVMDYQRFLVLVTSVFFVGYKWWNFGENIIFMVLDAMNHYD